MLKIQEDLLIYENDINDVIHIFAQYYNDDECKIEIQCKNSGKFRIIDVVLNNISYNEEIEILDQNLKDKRLIKRTIKFLLYQALSEFYNISMPWGSLTGVRPSKLVYDMLDDGIKMEEIPYLLNQDFAVSKEKANLICEVVKNQLEVKLKDEEVDFYINIPICPTRCSYCSFISSEYERCKKYIDDYVLSLIKEINALKELIKAKGLRIKNIYMGGGTPTTLTSEQLDMILSTIDFPFKEFTVECGRPDTITKNKLEVLKKHNVTRISINPQTLNDKTLEIIGRKHTSEDFYNKYDLAKNYDFIINTDLIAGLPNETFEDFKLTLDKIIELNPNNITIHTLAVKRASVLIQNTENLKDDYIQNMVEYAYDKLKRNNYKPYYLYRQKNMLGLYENVGYFEGSDICEFNVESMEEKMSIIACGAGAISKRIFRDESRIERSANVKQITDYIARIDEMIKRKIDLFN